MRFSSTSVGRAAPNHAFLRRVARWSWTATSRAGRTRQVNMVEQKRSTPSESRWRTGRISIRVHEDLKRALEFLASADRRTLSQYLELIALEHARQKLKNDFSNDGALEDGKRQPLVMRPASRR